MGRIIIDDEVTVNRPPTEVFQYLADFVNSPRWLSRVLKAERVSKGHLGKGTQFRVYSKFGRRKYDRTWEIVEFDPPERLTFETRSAPYPGIRRHLLVPQKNGGTRVLIRMEIHSLGFWQTLRRRTIERRSRAHFSGELLALKTRMEAEPRR